MRKRKAYKAILWIAILLFGLWLVKTFLVQPFVLLDENMEPTLKNERVYFIDRVSYRFRDPQRGEIVVFRTSEVPPLYFVKRIVGLAGERIKMEEGVVFINGKLFNESYAKVNSNWNFEEVSIGEGRVYVIDDNRGLWSGPNSHTKVAYKNIVGRIMGIK